MLELRHLRNLTVLARRLNYARAAEELGLTQPTLSRSIQALERQLGLQLFDRDRGGVSLTPQGRLFAERASFLLADADDLERQSQLSAAGDAGRIRFGMAPMPARALLSAVLSQRIAAAPEVANEVIVRDVEALWQLLLAGEIEFFVSQDGLLHDVSQARVDLLGHFPLSLIVRAGHPLLDAPDSDRRFPILRSSWAGLPLPPAIRDHVQGAPNVVEDFGTLAELTAATDAIWFSSAYAAAQELADGRLCELPQPHLHEVRVVMYTLARRSCRRWPARSRRRSASILRYAPTRPPDPRQSDACGSRRAPAKGPPAWRCQLMRIAKMRRLPAPHPAPRVDAERRR